MSKSTKSQNEQFELSNFDLGVGLVYWPALSPFLEQYGHLVDVIEIEPQFYWRELVGRGGQLQQAADFDRLRDLPHPKLLHSVGCPVGGSQPADPREIELLRASIDALHPPWISEHLSFNRCCVDGQLYHPLFLLPPLQTPEGVRAAVKSVTAFQAAMGIPVAVETGVNYLARQDGELPDGEFIAQVVDGADCGILLDLHNLVSNQRNGRDSVHAVLAALPLDRVWELHIAGGFERNGYWLDAHSGPADGEVLSLCAELLPRLPNLRSIIFEVLPSFIPHISMDIIADQLKWLRQLWDTSKRSRVSSSLNFTPCVRNLDSGGAGLMQVGTAEAVSEWESTLAQLVTGRPGRSSLAIRLGGDPGVSLLQTLVAGFRRGMVSDGLRFSLRLLMLTRGLDFLEGLFADFWRCHSPQPYTSTEAREFADYLGTLHVEGVPYLRDILAIECASLSARVEQIDAVACVRFDPVALMQALGAGEVPSGLAEGRFEIQFEANTFAGTGDRCTEGHQ
jgi:uncharacterized protein (UPF0276 family)